MGGGGVFFGSLKIQIFFGVLEIPYIFFFLGGGGVNGRCWARACVCRQNESTRSPLGY